VPEAGCLVTDGLIWLPLFVGTAILLLGRFTLFRLRLAGRGPPIPGLPSIKSLLHHGRYRGIPVRFVEGLDHDGGAFRRTGGRGAILLRADLAERADIDALAILEHELGHAERDLPAPRILRRAIGALFVAGLGVAALEPSYARVGALAMQIAVAIAALRLLRDEGAATEYALRALWARDLPRRAWRAAISRLAAAFGTYCADVALVAAAVGALTVVLECRAV